MTEDAGRDWRRLSASGRGPSSNLNPSMAKLALLGSYKKKRAVYNRPLAPTGMWEDYPAWLECRSFFGLGLKH